MSYFLVSPLILSGSVVNTYADLPDAATGGTEYADDIFITQVGVHVEKDMMGSRTVSAKYGRK